MAGETLPRARILMVDDSAANLLALEAILSRLGPGVELVRALSGREALRRILEPEEFALILLDVQMPDLDGFQTAKLIKERARSADVPIIFLTAFGVGEYVRKGYLRGAVDYIAKPFDAEILRSKVSVFVDLFRRGERIKVQAALLAEREREAAERWHEQRFGRLFDSMPLAVISSDAEGRATRVNKAFVQTFGTPRFAELPLVDPAAVHPDDIARMREAWRACCAGECPLEVELRMKIATGAWCWFLARAVAEHGKDGALSGWIATLLDIDGRRRAEDGAQAANRAKDEFLAIVSHELRTPLTAILGWAYLLRRRVGDPEKLERAIEVIERNARVQVEIIDDVLDVSRITTGKLRIKRESMDLSKAVEAAIDTVRPMADARHIRIDSRIGGETKGFFGDPERLQQVVWNLLTNAIKFSPTASRITISVDAGETEARIVVSDEGEGIAREFVPCVFDRFRQEDSGSMRAHGGLGLGLSIVKHIVEFHGGTVSASSAGHGQGATFTIKLPRGEADGSVAPTAAAPEKPAAAHSHDLESFDILFVEDQDDARESLGEALREAGATVRAVSSVNDAMHSLAEARPTVLVSDLGMPGEDGYSLIRRVRALPPEKGGLVPAIAVTGFVREEDERRSLAEGFQLHLRKPIDPDRLVQAIAHISDRT